VLVIFICGPFLIMLTPGYLEQQVSHEPGKLIGKTYLL